MFRFSISLALLAVFSHARADDLPKDISKERRNELVKQWQVAYKNHVDFWQQKKEDAITLTKFATSEKEGKTRLAEANKALAAMEDRPWNCSGSPFKFIEQKTAGIGDVVTIASGDPKSAFAFAGEHESGLLVETVTGGSQPTIRRYLVASPIKIPKDGKSKFAMPGLWYYAGEVEVKSKVVPILYRFELKPEDFPKK